MQQQQLGKDQLGSMRRSQSYHGLDPLGIPSAVYGAMHDIHASFIHAAPFGRRPKKQPSFATLPQSMKASFRTSDGVMAPAVPCPVAPGEALAGAAAHPVLSMLAEQVSCGAQLTSTFHRQVHQVVACYDSAARRCQNQWQIVQTNKAWGPVQHAEHCILAVDTCRPPKIFIVVGY